MNAMATPLPLKKDASDSVRQWIAELTDFTPTQIEAVLAQMEQQQPLQNSERNEVPVLN